MRMKDGTVIDLTDLHSDELSDLHIKLLNDQADIQGQLAIAKMKYQTEGISSDYEWYIKAEHAHRMMGRRLQTIQAEFARRKRERALSFERSFIKNARLLLSAEAYERIVDAARDGQVMEGKEEEA